MSNDLNIENTEFLFNKAYDGGSIYINGIDGLFMTKVNINHNYATNMGGGILMYRATKMTL